MFPKKPGIYVYLGKPASGKSFAVKNMIYDMAKCGYLKHVLCICRTKYNHDYGYLPDRAVWENYDEERLGAYLKRLQERTAAGKCPPNAIIFDDLLGTIPMYSAFFMNLIACHRHTNTSLFFTAQSLKRGLGTVLRECTNYAFMFRNINHDSLEAMWHNFGGLFKTCDEFKALLLDVTKEKHVCLLFVNNQNSIGESYFKFRAKPTPQFTLKY